MYRRTRAAPAILAVAVLLALTTAGPAWAIAVFATGVFLPLIWFVLLFGPADPLSGNEVSE